MLRGPQGPPSQSVPPVTVTCHEVSQELAWSQAFQLPHSSAFHPMICFPESLSLHLLSPWSLCPCPSRPPQLCSPWLSEVDPLLNPPSVSTSWVSNILSF